MSENRICHQGQKTGHTYKISMGTIISEHTEWPLQLLEMMSKNNSSLIHFHIVVQCSQASLLWNSRLPLTQEAKTKTSPILLAQSGQRRLAHIFSNFWRTSALRWEPIHLPYSSWGWPTKTSQRARGKKYHVLQPLANSLSAVWGRFLKNRKIFLVFCFPTAQCAFW